MLDVALLERLARGGLHEPRRLRQRPHLVGQELDLAVQASSLRLCLAEPPELLARDRFRNVLKIPVRNEGDLAPPHAREASRRTRRSRAAPRAPSFARRGLLRAAACRSPRGPARRSRVEVDADRIHGQVREALLEQPSALPNVTQSASFGPPPSFWSAAAQPVSSRSPRARGTAPRARPARRRAIRSAA